jgi:Curli production assembly/transport component CsgG
MFRKLSPLFVLLLFFAAALPAAAQVEKGLYKLGLVSGVKDKRYESEQERRYREEVLNAATDAFVAARRFKMVERNQLDAIFTEKSLQEFIGGQVNNKLSDVLGLDLVGVVGYTVETSKSPQGEPTTKCIIDVRLVDVKTAALLTTVSSDRPTLMPPTTPREAGDLLYKNLREAFPPLGYVVSVSGKEVVVDLGTEAGLKDGDTLEIVTEGEQIIHPVTGKVLASPLKVVGELRVVTASPQISTCKLRSREEPAVASMVRLKPRNTNPAKAVGKIPFIKRIIKDAVEVVKQ